jgi:hypothetical protein
MSSGLSSVAFPISGSSRYDYIWRERDEIAKHKWLLSERAVKDVGWGYAEWHWIIWHRAAWVSGQHI